jgi:phenylacetate-CoA ligase
MWNKDAESMPRDGLEKVQLERLQNIAAHAENVPFYKSSFEQAGVSAKDIKSLDDIAKLPFTVKDHLRDNYPWGMFAVPLEEVVRVHASSGTTGKPTVGGYSAADLDLWGEVMARTVAAAGVTHEDVVHNAYGYGLFTGGLGFHLGAQTVGATVIPVSGGLSRRQIMLMEDFGATVLTCTPSYALVLYEEAKAMGMDFSDRMKVRVGVFGAEPWTEKMREEIERFMGIEAYDIYGLTEIIGPGVSVECEHHVGLHIFEDHFYPEVIDPESGDPLGYGVEGELVFTTLTKEAMPMIRYRTRDLTVLHKEKCDCGRTMVRMEKVLGRSDDMMIVRGVNVFPSQIERVLLSTENVEPHYQIFIDREKHKLDKLEIWVEGSEVLFTPVDAERVAQVEKDLGQAMFQALGISANVKLVSPGGVARSQGKAVRVVDRRDMN